MTQFDLFYYWPVIQWDFWIGSAAICGAAAFSGAYAWKSCSKPADVLSEYGYGSASKDSAWAVLVMLLRVVSAYTVMVSAFSLYYWYAISMRYAVFFNFWMEFPVVALFAYRAFQEDQSNGLCSKLSKDNSIKSLKLYGAKTGFVAFASIFLWLEFYNGTNYVKDAKHGLPEELTMMLGVVKNKFLKGH